MSTNNDNNDFQELKKESINADITKTKNEIIITEEKEEVKCVKVISNIATVNKTKPKKRSLHLNGEERINNENEKNEENNSAENGEKGKVKKEVI